MSLSDFSAAPSLSLSPPPARRRPPIDLALPRPPYAPGPARQHSHSDEVQRIRERIRDRVRANSGPSQPRNAANNGVIDLTLSDSDDEPVVVASRITAPARAPRNVAQVPGLFVPRNRVRVEVEVPRRVELPARERRVPSEEARDNLRGELVRLNLMKINAEQCLKLITCQSYNVSHFSNHDLHCSLPCASPSLPL